jgi:hypothetical protein
MDDPELSDEDSKLAYDAMGFPPEKPREKSPADRAHEAREQGYAALKSAERAARKNDLAAAKKWTDTAARMAEIAAKLANTPAPQSSWEEEEAVREELRERLTKFANDNYALHWWRIRHEIWEEMAAEAQRTGAPMPSSMPPRPPHWADALPEELRQRILEEPLE